MHSVGSCARGVLLTCLAHPCEAPVPTSLDRHRGTLADAVLRQRAFHSPLEGGCVGVSLPALLEVR